MWEKIAKFSPAVRHMFWRVWKLFFFSKSISTWAEMDVFFGRLDTRIQYSHEKADARYRRRAIWLFARIFGKFVTAELLQLVDLLWNSGCHVYYLIVLISMLRYFVNLLYIRTVIGAWTSVVPFSRLDRTPNAGDLTAKVTDPRAPGSGQWHIAPLFVIGISNNKSQVLTNAHFRYHYTLVFKYKPIYSM